MTSHSKYRTNAALGLLGVAVLAGLLPGASIHAQDPDAPEPLDDLSRLVDSIAPMNGAPGTTVRVTTRDMPVGTPVRVGVGAPGGFEALLELLTGDEGDFDVEITVPEWATWDRVHFVVVFDVYFRPIARSRPFHVTNEQGHVQRRGRLRAPAEDCHVFRDRDGIDYLIVGPGALWDDLERTALSDPDATVIVEGRVETEGERPAEGASDAPRPCGDHPRLTLTRVQG